MVGRHGHGVRATGARMRKAAAAGRVALAWALALMLAMPLAGCRASDVLTEKIIGEPLQYEVDYSLSPVAIENPMASSDISQDEDESDRQDETQEDSPQYGEDATTNDQTNQTQQDANSHNDADAQSGTSAGGTGTGDLYDGTGTSTSGSRITIDLTGSTDVNDPDAQAPTDTPADEPNDDQWDGNNDNGGGTSTKPSTVVKAGDYSSLPQVSTVAAAGVNATLVQAIGGTGALAVCNQEWYDSLPSQAFSNKSELANTVRISSWGDGSSMNDQAFQDIVNALPHDGTAAVVVNERTWNAAYDEAFQAQNISVVVLPAMGVADARDDGVMDAVAVVGELLAGMADGGAYAKSQAQAWKQLHNQALERTKQYNGGYTTSQNGLGGYSIYAGNYLYTGDFVFANPITDVSNTRFYTVYIDSWASSKYTSYSSNASHFYFKRNNGDSVRVWPFNDSAWSIRLSDNLTTDLSDGVGIGAYRSGDLASTSYFNAFYLFQYYFQHSGVVDVAVGQGVLDDPNSSEGTSSSDYFNVTNPRYGHPIVLHGGYLFIQTNSSSSSAVSVGNESYPYIIVRTKQLANNVASSASKADKATKTVGLYNYGTNYGLVVMPYGVSGSWADGTFESFLMAPYLYCIYQERDGSKINFSYSDDFANQFYSQFYRCGSGGILDNTDSTWENGGYGGYGYIATAVCSRG